jgi:flagellum-specific peptidoglycan hydrolase FlgJ
MSVKELTERIKKLPKDKQQSVADYVEFLLNKTQYSPMSEETFLSRVAESEAAIKYGKVIDQKDLEKESIIW